MDTKAPQVPGCVRPPGRFQVAVHRPAFQVANMRGQTRISCLGATDAREVDNAANFPLGDVEEGGASWIYEIRNPLPFRGATFIDSSRADRLAQDPEAIRLPGPGPCSLAASLDQEPAPEFYARLPRAVRHGLAPVSTDPRELAALARTCCDFIMEDGQPAGLRYQGDPPRPVIHDHDLYEALANNPHLPEAFRRVMVLVPGAQGGSEIVGEVAGEGTHVYEYLRRNSYIPWGHFAANMAEDAVRYRIAELGLEDMRGLRRLYYQRVYVALAMEAGLEPPRGRLLDDDALEDLRQQVLAARDQGRLGARATLWGWNFGFDYSGSGYRLHASHQQIHQQYALVPEQVDGLPAFAVGDLVARHMEDYRQAHDRDFFQDYLTALVENSRTDQGAGPADLIVWSQGRVILYVPKAQVSQWELQIMVTPAEDGTCAANVVDCDPATREALDTALLKAQQALEELGARMVTSIEYSGRLGAGARGQCLVYALLPKLPYAMGGFTEAQLRFISGHYPEDFARACILALRRRQAGTTHLSTLSGND